jgi:hypothetical protein
MLSMLLSCSSEDKFNGDKKQHIQIEKISYGEDGYGNVYLFGNLQTEIESCTSLNSHGANNLPSNFWRINNMYYSLRNLDACYLSDYLWIIDDKIIPSYQNPYNVGFGEHLVELVLIDLYGDSISYSASIRINEPLKITLLSPINGFSTTEPVIFQYNISGVDSWEQMRSFVYASTDKESLWEKENRLADNVLSTPIEKPVFWGVMAFTDSGDSVRSTDKEIRYLWPKN